MAGQFSHLFEKQATHYAAYRPDYPAELYDRVYKFCDFRDTPSVALDIATGSGQAAIELAKTFKKVIAIDSNATQLIEAKRASNIEYNKRLAEATGVADHSVDLITVAQALHWFDFEKFWLEAARVLKPNGAFAAWGYGLSKCQNNEEGTRAIRDWAYGDDMLGPYWSPRRRLIDEEYATIIPDEALFDKITRSNISTTSECTIDFFVGYLSTYSAYSTFRQRHPDRPDPLEQIRSKLMASYRCSDGQQKMGFNSLGLSNGLE